MFDTIFKVVQNLSPEKRDEIINSINDLSTQDAKHNKRLFPDFQERKDRNIYPFYSIYEEKVKENNFIHMIKVINATEHVDFKSKVEGGTFNLDCYSIERIIGDHNFTMEPYKFEINSIISDDGWSILRQTIVYNLQKSSKPCLYKRDGNNYYRFFLEGYLYINPVRGKVEYVNGYRNHWVEYKEEEYADVSNEIFEIEMNTVLMKLFIS